MAAGRDRPSVERERLNAERKERREEDPCLLAFRWAISKFWSEALSLAWFTVAHYQAVPILGRALESVV